MAIYKPQINNSNSDNSENDDKTNEQPDISRLEEMSREELLGLVRLCNADRLEVALMSEYEIRQAFLHRLAVTGIKDPDITKAMNAIERRLNRSEGTPIQRSEDSLDVRSVSIEVRSYKARNEQIDRILNLGKLPNFP